MNWRYFILLHFLAFHLHLLGVEGQEKQTICLNMIVKNETTVIERCLDSVARLVDYWVIVDTGSTDGTQELIKNYMSSRGIPGELHERPWVNFGHNRNEALQYAKSKADYLLFIDADEYILYDNNFKLPILDKDFYYFDLDHSGYHYGKVQLIRTKLDWRWEGVLHEYVDAPTANSCEVLPGVVTIYTTEGNRSKDPLKFAKDAALLEEALKSEPDNLRYWFYLAQSYSHAGQNQLALENYKKRATMGGFDQEVFWSLLQIPIIEDYLGESTAKVVDGYYRAFEYRPSRVEPLYYLINLYRRKGNYEEGYKIATQAEKIPPSTDIHFNQHWMSQYGIQFEKSICAYWVGKYEEALEISLALLKKRDLPKNVRETVEKNLGYTHVALMKKASLGAAE